MNEVTIDHLINAINENPSEYEELHVRWVSISYDKEVLCDLLYELRHLRDNEPENPRIEFLQKILDQFDRNHLLGLLSNDPQISRMALIEKYARVAAMEMLIRGKYTIQTLDAITQLPLSDYQLVIKRTQELVSVIRDVTVQAEKITSGVAGA